MGWGWYTLQFHFLHFVGSIHFVGFDKGQNDG